MCIYMCIYIYITCHLVYTFVCVVYVFAVHYTHMYLFALLLFLARWPPPSSRCAPAGR